MATEINIETLINKRSELLERLTQYEEIKRDIDAIDRVLRLNGVDINNIKETKTVDIIKSVISIPKEYSNALTWMEKCLYVLKINGALSADMVAKRVKELQPEIELNLAEQRCTYSLSKLKKDGYVKVLNKNGKKYEYSL